MWRSTVPCTFIATTPCMYEHSLFPVAIAARVRMSPLSSAQRRWGSTTLESYDATAREASVCVCVCVCAGGKDYRNVPGLERACSLLSSPPLRPVTMRWCCLHLSPPISLSATTDAPKNTTSVEQLAKCDCTRCRYSTFLDLLVYRFSPPSSPPISCLHHCEETHSITPIYNPPSLPLSPSDGIHE